MCFNAVSAAALALAADRSCGCCCRCRHHRAPGMCPTTNVHNGSAREERRVREQEARAQEESVRERCEKMAEERAEERGRSDSCGCNVQRPAATNWHPSCPRCR